MLALVSTVSTEAVTTYDVHLETSGLKDQAAIVIFDLVAGDSSDGNNTVRIFDFDISSDGSMGSTADLVLLESGLIVSGQLDVVFGSAFSFSVELSENFAPPGLFDSLSFFVLDSSGILPMVDTSDPTFANALFAIDITGDHGGVAHVFASQTPGVSWSVTLRRDATPVPDAGPTFALACVSLISLSALNIRGRA